MLRQSYKHISDRYETLSKKQAIRFVRFGRGAVVAGVILSIVVLAIAVTLISGRSRDKESLQTAQQARVAEIRITSEGFSPQHLVVDQDTAVIWINEDADTHQIIGNIFPYAEQSGGIQSEILNNGQEYEYKIQDKSTLEYYDSTNQNFTGTVEVKH